MAVDLESERSTWQIHLDGLLTMLQQPGINISQGETFTLVTALRTLNSQDQMVKSMASREMDHFEKTQLILDVAKLRLRALTIEMDALFTKSRQPRKLDMQKFRHSIKQIHRDLAIVPSMLPKEVTFPKGPSVEQSDEVAPFPTSILCRSGHLQQRLSECEMNYSNLASY
jgi:hypothetical protein